MNSHSKKDFETLGKYEIEYIKFILTDMKSYCWKVYCEKYKHWGKWQLLFKENHTEIKVME